MTVRRVRGLEATPCGAPIIVGQRAGNSPPGKTMPVTVEDEVLAGTTLALVPLWAEDSIIGVADSRGNIWTVKRGLWQSRLVYPLQPGDTVTVTWGSATGPSLYMLLLLHCG